MSLWLDLSSLYFTYTIMRYSDLRFRHMNCRLLTKIASFYTWKRNRQTDKVPPWNHVCCCILQRNPRWKHRTKRFVYIRCTYVFILRNKLRQIRSCYLVHTYFSVFWPHFDRSLITLNDSWKSYLEFSKPYMNSHKKWAILPILRQSYSAHANCQRKIVLWWNWSEMCFTWSFWIETMAYSKYQTNCIHTGHHQTRQSVINI